jgi:hypothetical protein
MNNKIKKKKRNPDTATRASVLVQIHPGWTDVGHMSTSPDHCIWGLTQCRVLYPTLGVRLNLLWVVIAEGSSEATWTSLARRIKKC